MRQELEGTLATLEEASRRTLQRRLRRLKGLGKTESIKMIEFLILSTPSSKNLCLEKIVRELILINYLMYNLK